MKTAVGLLFTYLIFNVQTAHTQDSTYALAQSRPALTALISDFDATVGMAVIHIESGDTLTLNNTYSYPMQSVYKFPLALAVLEQVDQKNLALDQKIDISKADLHPDTWSPLAEKYPDGNIDLTLAELLEYTVSQSDNNTCDILFRLMNGPAAVEKYVSALGYTNIIIQTTEAEMHADGPAGQTKNWCQPFEMSQLLVDLYKQKLLSETSNAFLMKCMIESSNSAKRIKGLLPESTVTAHKTGSGNKVVNDVGIITLPDGTHVAVAVFICNANEEFEDAELLIAKLCKVIYDRL